MIGGLAVNCYAEPVYTLDADIVVIAKNISHLAEHLRGHGFRIDEYPHSINAQAGSDLRIQFTIDERYQSFLERSVESEVLGIRVRVASLRDVTQGKLWAFGDPHRRLSKRKKDELDLIRLAEVHPELREMYPRELREQIERG